eukprot:TRINITY_DN628_c0_g1_i1.p1 TRINITY_DN628_c0_g1~~TRINITY_DN628_c0_g1_i1.p1  ORF type:complete len:380 (+),score=101.96 TRINITY_DN628_c0_g1_i1:32-1141(+)
MQNITIIDTYKPDNPISLSSNKNNNNDDESEIEELNITEEDVEILKIKTVMPLISCCVLSSETQDIDDKPYTVYFIEATSTIDSRTWICPKRYSELLSIHNYLNGKYASKIKEYPHFPGKHILTKKTEPNLVVDRTKKLNVYISEIVKNLCVINDSKFQTFLELRENLQEGTLQKAKDEAGLIKQLMKKKRELEKTELKEQKQKQQIEQEKNNLIKKLSKIDLATSTISFSFNKHNIKKPKKSDKKTWYCNYIITCKLDFLSWKIQRRDSAFILLHETLSNHDIVGTFPEFVTVDLSKSNFISQVKKDLKLYLTELVSQHREALINNQAMKEEFFIFILPLSEEDKKLNKTEIPEFPDDIKTIIENKLN